MNKTDLLKEAERCLLCQNPRCKQYCPISTEIPKIISLFKENKITEAGEILFENNPLSAICAIVCPHEKQCEGHCIVGIKNTPINFPKIERYISEYFIQKKQIKNIIPNGKKIAIVGAGPAGITLAFILAKRGYDITIFEMNSELGGILRYGIPDFRLPRKILTYLEKRLLEKNIKIRYNDLIGPVTTVDKLLEDGYNAVFIGTGVWNPKPLGVPGETGGNVHYAINYLKSPHSFKLGNKVLVIGGGNVAIDAARTAKRNGSQVIIYYRRALENMPATKAEISEAIEDGVEFEFYHTPEKILKNGMEFLKGPLDALERESVFIECDSVIVAVSQIPKNNIVSNTEGIDVSSSGLIITTNNGHTTKKGIFAAGDVVSGAKTVVAAVAEAKLVAQAIDEYCKKNSLN